MNDRPNVIYMHSHDTGRRISPYGYPVHTPHLQRFAREATVFRQAFCAAPTCSPSRAALLTGQCAHSSGMLGLHHRGFRLADPSHHLCTTLRAAGYSTTLVGVNHVIADVAEAGYERVIPTATSNAVNVGPAAARFLREKPREPFFLDVGFVETHRGQFPQRHPDEDPRFIRPIPGLPDMPETREDAALFASAARLLDQGVGQVLSALADSGLDRNTLVISTTDHGISFPRHKCMLFDGGLEVLLMLRGPRIEPGRIVDSLVSQVDLFPTLCDYLGIPPPTWLQGRSLMPILRGEVAEVRGELFAETTFHAAYQAERAVRTKRHKYIRRYGDTRPQPLSNLDDGLSKSLYFANGYHHQVQPAEALYDLVFDPLEQNNLVAQPDLQPTLADLRQKLDRWMADTHDPLLAGPVPVPPGAVVNDFSDYSAKDVLTRGH